MLFTIHSGISVVATQNVWLLGDAIYILNQLEALSNGLYAL